MESIPLRKKILETIVSKSTLKQKVFDNTFATFNDLKETLLEMASEMDDQLDGLLDRRVRLEYRDRGKFEAQIQVANDLLIFQMHTDVFEFEPNHVIWQNPYVQTDRDNSYCGVINIYNFLSDSFKFNRNADEGYLIGEPALAAFSSTVKSATSSRGNNRPRCAPCSSAKRRSIPRRWSAFSNRRSIMPSISTCCCPPTTTTSA